MKKSILSVYNRIKKDVVNNRTGILAFAGIFLLFLFLFRDVCPLQIIFGLPCPGCGLTRAGIRLLTGDFIGAWKMHPFIYVWVFFFLYLCYKRYIRGKKMVGLIPIVVGITLAMLVFYLYRMYQFFPDVEPMTKKDTILFEVFKQWLQ